MSIYKRKSGRYAVLIDVDRKPDGKRLRRALGTFATRKEAERAERDALSARDRGIDLVPDRVTVSETVRRYIDDAAIRCGAKTIERYRDLARLYVDPRIGSLPLAKLRPAHVSEWVVALHTSGGREDRPLSAKSVSHAYALVQSALRWAVRMQLVGRNVCEAVKPPVVLRSPAKALSTLELSSILSVAADSRWGPFVTLAFALGARRGELLALTWDDVDNEAGTVTIRASISQTRTGIFRKSTKTDRVRVVPLSRVAVEAFRRQRALQAQDKLRAGGGYMDEGNVFADALGQLQPPMRATDAFRELAKSAGIKTTRLHDARHTTATLLLTSGVDVRTTAGVLGHANPSITLSVYGHLVENAQRAAIDGLGAAIDAAAVKEKTTG